MIGARLDQAELVDVRHHRRHAVITQAAGVETRRNERRSQRVHLDQRRQVRGVAEVVGVFAARQRRACGRLDRDEAALAPAAQLQPEEREGKPGEVRAAAGAADHDVGVVARHLELLDRFLAVDGLVQQHVVEHGAERIFHRRILGGHLHRLGNGDAERARTFRVLGEDGPAGIGLVRRRGDAARAIGFHQRAAIGLLIVGHADLEHGHVDAEQPAGKSERRAPLAGAGLGGEPLDALLLVVPGLRHRGVRLVRARRRDAFVFEIDLGRRLQRLLQPARADQRRRPPHAVDVADRLRDVDGALRRHLLQDQRHREQRLEIAGADRLLGAGMQNRRQRLRQIGREVVPSFRNLRFVENEFDLTAHATPPR